MFFKSIPLDFLVRLKVWLPHLLARVRGYTSIEHEEEDSSKYFQFYRLFSAQTTSAKANILGKTIYST